MPLIEKFIGVVSVKSEIPAEILEQMHPAEAKDGSFFAIDKIESDPVETYDDAKAFIEHNVEQPGFVYGQVEKVFVAAE
ncbi:hypothetical protein [Paenibacillus rhizovicinus]|nr:hypothetical protein [Paenibacillus rhizovicinus]